LPAAIVPELSEKNASPAVDAGALFSPGDVV